MAGYIPRQLLSLNMVGWWCTFAALVYFASKAMKLFNFPQSESIWFAIQSGGRSSKMCVSGRIFSWLCSAVITWWQRLLGRKRISVVNSSQAA